MLWKDIHQTVNSACLWEEKSHWKESKLNKKLSSFHSVFFYIFCMVEHVFLYFFYYLKLHILLNSQLLEF